MNTEDYFTGKITEYEQYRPYYPDEYFDLFPVNDESNVVDIGAGTGYVSIPLAQKGFNVVAVEPNYDMRGCLEQKIFQQNIKRIRVESSKADETSAANQSIDYVTLGNVAHWLDNQPEKLSKCRGEFERILKPTGQVAVMAVSPSMDNNWINSLFRMVQDYDPEFDIEKITRTFSDPEFHALNFIETHAGYCKNTHETSMTMDEFLGFIQSHSFCTPDMSRDLQSIYDENKNGSGIAVKFLSSIYIGKPKFNSPR